MEALSPCIVLAAYAEALIDGRRMVLFGDSTSRMASELIERGARNVQVYDPEPSRAALAAGQNRTKQIAISPHDDADLAVRDGAFDVAFVEDLSTFADPPALLQQVRRALSTRGAAIVAAPNPDAKTALIARTGPARAGKPLGYYELYDNVSAEFAEVRMLGQTPFVGYAVVDFAPDGEPDVSIDSGLLPGGTEEPEWFVALGSRDPLDVDPMGIVQLPAHGLTGGGATDDLAEQLRTARATETGLLERVADLEIEASDLRVQRQVGNDASLARVAHLERDVSQRDAKLADLEARIAAADARDARAREEIQTLRQSAEGGDAARKEIGRLTAESSRLGDEVGTLARDNAGLRNQVAEVGTLARDNAGLRDQVATLSRKIGELTELVARAEAKAEVEKTHLAATVAEQRARVTVLDQALSEKDAKLAELLASADEAPNDLAELESALVERGEHVRKLTEQLRESERVGRELLRELGRANGSEPLQAENARLKANLEALSWTVEELEGRLSGGVAAAR